MTADSLLAVAYAALILLVRTSPQSSLAKIARWTWLRKLGGIAYGVYIIHMAVLGLVFAVMRGHWPYFLHAGDLLPVPIALIITLVVASGSWRWFEKPFIAVGQRHRYEYPNAYVESFAGVPDDFVRPPQGEVENRPPLE